MSFWRASVRYRLPVIMENADHLFNVLPARPNKRARVSDDMDAWYAFSRTIPTASDSKVKTVRFLGLSGGTYGTDLRSVRLDADGSLVGLKQPFSLIIKPSLDDAGKVKDITAYVVQDIAYNQPLGYLERDDWGTVLSLLTVMHRDFVHLPAHLEAHVSRACYRPTKNELLIDVDIEPHECKRRCLPLLWLRYTAEELYFRGQPWDPVDVYESSLKSPRWGVAYGSLRLLEPVSPAAVESERDENDDPQEINSPDKDTVPTPSLSF